MDFLRLLLPAGAGAAVLVLAPAATRGWVTASLAAVAGVAGWIATRHRAREVRLADWVRGVRGGERVPAPLATGEPDALDRISSDFGSLVEEFLREGAGLREERDRLEAVLGAMVEGVLVIDANGTILRANDRAREIFEVAPDDTLVGRRLGDVSRDPELGAFVRESSASAGRASRELEVRGAIHRFLRVNSGPTVDGRFRVLVFHDVTDTRRLERVRTDFVANVSHELRTPLTAIKGFAETLASSGFQDRESAARYVGIIDRHAGRLGRLIDDLLVLSDLELGRGPLSIEDLGLADAVRDAAELLAEPARRGGVAVELAVPDVLRVACDPDRLAQVLSNLLDNAIKYAPGGHVRLAAKVFGDGTMVELAVSDDGCGIPAEDLPRIAERFYRVDKARGREFGGTGLGLSIVKHIVQLHGGQLSIESRLGGGTTVRVALPRATESRGSDMA
ncbi:MAG: hypothetical protein RL698_2076 [Pseudomonadota bacterium]